MNALSAFGARRACSLREQRQLVITCQRSSTPGDAAGGYSCRRNSLGRFQATGGKRRGVHSVLSGLHPPQLREYLREHQEFLWGCHRLNGALYVSSGENLPTTEVHVSGSALARTTWRYWRIERWLKTMTTFLSEEERAFIARAPGKCRLTVRRNVERYSAGLGQVVAIRRLALEAYGYRPVEKPP